MSQITVNRLPGYVRRLLQVYERCGEQNHQYHDPSVRIHLQKQSDQHRLFIRHKILQKRINLSNTDFPPLQKRLVLPMFLKQFSYDYLENHGIDDLFRPEYNQLDSHKLSATDFEHQQPSSIETAPILPRIVSARNISINRYSPYQANLIKSLAAYFSPRRHVPNVLSYNNIFTWFQRLLSYTPVVIILRQPQRLFSEASINQVNYPYSNLQYQVEQLSQGFGNSDENLGTRAYHLTELVDTDILSLALKSKLDYDYNMLIAGTNHSKLNWPKYGLFHDKLSQLLHSCKQVTLLHKEKPYEGDPNKAFTQDYIDSTMKFVEDNLVSDVFPFDLAYNDYFILTIESAILHANHDDLMKLILDMSEFDVCAVRLDLNNPLLQKSLKYSTSTNNTDSNSDYQHLLQSIHKPPTSNVDKLIQSFAELGLTNVSHGINRDSLYLCEPFGDGSVCR